MSELWLHRVVRFSTFFGAMIFAVLVHLAIDFLMPGRRGRLKTQRRQEFPGFQPADVMTELARRLSGEGFEVTRTTDGSALTAERGKKRPKDSIFRNFPFEKLKLRVEARVGRGHAGPVLDVAVEANDYITRDTGEGEYFEALLDFLTFQEKIRRVSPALNFNCQFTMEFGLVAMPLPLLAFLPGMSGEIGRQFLVGLLIVGVFLVGNGFWGVLQVVNSQGRYHGAQQGIIGMTLGVVFLGATTAIYMLQ